MHYKRWLAHGDPLLRANNDGVAFPSSEARFWSKVNKEGSVPLHDESLGPCWEWTASVHKGYGQASFRGGMCAAYRVAYLYLVGPVPDTLVLDHLCENKLCVNPGHLEPVTQAENMRRSVLRKATVIAEVTVW